jgi:hypothetical protein
LVGRGIREFLGGMVSGLVGSSRESIKRGILPGEVASYTNDIQGLAGPPAIFFMGEAGAKERFLSDAVFDDLSKASSLVCS